MKLADGTTNVGTLVNNDQYGVGVAGIGDLDHDGVQDIAVGLSGDDTGGSGRGAVDIHYMNANGSIKSTVKIASGTTNAPTLADGDSFGTSIANMGDMDNDGVSEMAVSSLRDDTGGADRGAVSILFMNSNGSIKSNAKIAHGTSNGPTLADTDFYGQGVANIGDLDDDGVTDLAVGAQLDDTGAVSAGAVYIHYLNANGSVKSTVKIANGTTNGPTLAVGDNYGRGVAALGDWDGDGVTELAVGAVGDDTGGSNRGAVYLHYMNANGSIKSTVKLTSSTTNGAAQGNLSKYGLDVVSPGDYDMDGISDLVVGAASDGTVAPAFYIHLMNADGSIDTTYKIDANTANGGSPSVGNFYAAAISAVDINGDGLKDFVVGDNADDTGGSNRGAVYVHFMRQVTSTTSNAVTMSRVKASASSTVSVSFGLSSALNGTLTVTFPAGFTVTGAATSGSCTGGGSVGSFGFTSSTLTAVKTNCSGTLSISGATVTNPATPGTYVISWVNDDPGSSAVYVTSDDQVTVTAAVAASLTFDLDTAAADTCGATETAAPYAVALGTVTSADTRVSGATDGVGHICVDLTTNSSGGAVVTVQNANGSSGLASGAVPADDIDNAAGVVGDGTENYGLCVVSTSAAVGTLDDEGNYNGDTCAANSETNAVAALTTTPANIFDTDADPVSGGRGQISVQASITSTQPAHGDYADILTFIATGTF